MKGVEFFISLVTALATAGSFVFIARYFYETKRLRETAELEHRPFLGIEYEPQAGRLLLKNYGRGLAKNVLVRPSRGGTQLIEQSRPAMSPSPNGVTELFRDVHWDVVEGMEFLITCDDINDRPQPHLRMRCRLQRMEYLTERSEG